MRKIINFNSDWVFNKNNVVFSSLPLEGEKVTLPHTWNNIDGQDGGDDYYRGTCSYSKSFTRPEGEEVYIEFKGVNASSVIYLNGEKVFSHDGGYSLFRVNLTPYLRDNNVITVLVDNSHSERVYPQRADFTFYGGIYRDVSLISVCKEHFALDYYGTPGIKVTPVINEKDGSATVTVETWQNTKKMVKYTLLDENKVIGSREVESINGKAEVSFTLFTPHLWNGTIDPHLYKVEAEIESDKIKSEFGLRYYSFDGDKGFFLNGKSYPLRGVSRHQDRKGKGNALSLSDHEEDIALIREIGANTVRLAHYEQAEEFYSLCDKYGLVVWAEIPYISSNMKDGRENTISQMKELIIQCYNHPSIICWGLSNEITSDGQNNEELLSNHHELNDLVHSMDKTRVTTMAHVFMQDIHGDIVHISDISSYNLYFGWYVGETKETGEFFDTFHKEYPKSVIGFSEYGADGNVRFHSEHPDKGDYTEEFQAIYHEYMLKTIVDRPYLWATHVWNMFDFAADGRDEGGEHGLNQKGLVSFDRKTKKDAFYLYKAMWNKEKMIHLTSKRFKERQEEKTTIKVYSNSSTVTLFLDDKEMETKTSEGSILPVIFYFEIPTGVVGSTHSIKVISAEGLEDTLTFTRVEKISPEYSLQKVAVVNWFDKDKPINPDYYSIEDTMAALWANEEASKLLEPITKATQQGRGEVMDNALKNPNLLKMIGRTKVVSMLKQAGNVPPEAISALNDALQKIKK